MRPDRLLTAVLVIVVTLAVWAGVRFGPYRYDDYLVPLGDDASLSLSGLAHHLDTTLRPLTKLTYALEGAAGSVEPEQRRLLSAGILAVGGALLSLLLGALAHRSGHDVPPLACGALALCWSLHPVQAESVLAISGRSAVLSSTLVLAALLATVCGRPLAGAALLLLAVLARETAIAAALPVAIASCATHSSWRERGRRLVPVAATTLLVLLWIPSVPRHRELAAHSYAARPLAVSMARQLAAIPAGIALYVDTPELSADHGPALPDAIGAPAALLGLALLAGATLLACSTAGRAPAFAVGLALWVAAIAPTQTIVPKDDPLTERPLALALAGLLVAGSFPLAVAMTRRPRRIALPLGAALAATAVLCAMATAARGRLYASDIALWGDAASKSITNTRPHVNYAVSLARVGRYHEAAVAFRRALAIDPHDEQAERGADAMDTRERWQWNGRELGGR